MSDASDLSRRIGSQAQLVRLMCVFNQNPADYIDNARLTEFFPTPVDDRLLSCVRARRHLSQHILGQMGVEPCLDLARPEWRIALLERDRLYRLARHVAAALVGGQVRRSLSRDEVVRWRDWLSADAHEFAVAQAGFLSLNSVQGRVDRQLSAQEVGLGWIFAAMRQWPEAIAQRFLLKLPSNEVRTEAQVDAAQASRLVFSVLSIVESRWCSLFAATRH